MRRGAHGLVLAGVLWMVFAMTASAALHASGPGDSEVSVRQAQVLEAERTGVPSPVGLAFSSAGSAFYVVDGPPGRGSQPAETDVVKLTPFKLSPDSDRAGSARIAAAVKDPINMAFDARRNRLLLLDSADRLLEVQADAKGDLDPATLVRRDALRLDVENPQGMTVDPGSGSVFILDAAQPRIVRVEPAPDGSFEQALISAVDLRASGVSDVRGLAFDPASGHLQLGGDQKLHELTTAGQVVAVRDLSQFALANPQGMVFAPSGDQTDDPGELSVYLADSGGRAAGSPQAVPSSGQIVELSLTPLPSVASIDFTASLVNTVDMAAFSPPSPDPSGLTYLPQTNTLLMVDGEVEETVSGITHFQGVNVWELTLAGSVVDTANISKKQPTVVPMTDEPVGVTWQPSSGHYFVSDDNGKRVYNLNPGGDGEIGTVDDSWSYFSTIANGNDNGDPEGITYDTARDRLFVADGVNAEIYQYTTTGTLIGHFDVLSYGIADPETVEYNAQSDTLFVLSNRQSGPIIVETSLGGALLQTIDVSNSGARKPAGLAYAPASNGSGLKRFYLVDRGIDNNSDPRIVDGKMYEMTAPPVAGNNPPAITSDGGGPSAAKSVSENQTAVTTVTATDADNDPLSYSIAGGPDAARFTIVAATGVLSFLVAPNFEAPTDVGGNNVYDVTVRASDGSLFDEQALAVTVSDVADNPSPLYFSLSAAATVGGVTAANEDILYFDGTGFSLYFDGSDVGLASLRIDAFARLDSTTLLLSFGTDGAVLPGIAGAVDDSDIVQFDATSLGTATTGSFQLYFDGSDVGLTVDAHDLDAVELLPGGQILVSTTGSVTVSGVSARDEDLLEFTPTSLGDVTAGSFSPYFDGSDVEVGLGDSSEDVDAAAVDASGKIYLSTTNGFAVPDVSGDDEDVFVFTPTALGSTTSGTYSPALYFDGSSWGLGANDVSAIDLS